MNGAFIPLFEKKMMVNPLPNNRIHKPKKRKNAALVKTLFPWINVEGDKLCSSIS
jgi:hypothetical protein